MLHKRIFYDNRYYTVTECNLETREVNVEPENSALVKALYEVLTKNMRLIYYINTDSYAIPNQIDLV